MSKNTFSDVATHVMDNAIKCTLCYMLRAKPSNSGHTYSSGSSFPACPIRDLFSRYVFWDIAGQSVQYGVYRSLLFETFLWVLTLNMLGNFFSRRHFKIVLLFFFTENRF